FAAFPLLFDMVQNADGTAAADTGSSGSKRWLLTGLRLDVAQPKIERTQKFALFLLVAFEPWWLILTLWFFGAPDAWMTSLLRKWADEAEKGLPPSSSSSSSAAAKIDSVRRTAELPAE